MKDYTRPRTNAQVLASRREDLGGVVRKMSIPNRCVWPECTRGTWLELQLPLCHKHAARTHVKVADVIPAEGSRIHQRSDPEGWWTNPGHVYGNRRDEKRTHFMFGELWIEGEYFSNDPRLMEYIRQVTEGLAVA